MIFRRRHAEGLRDSPSGSPASEREELSATAELVEAFVASLGEAAAELERAGLEVGRSGTRERFGPLVARTPSGEFLREGRLPGGWWFKLHGIGCRIETEDGVRVDFDWDRAGRKIFDPWRIRVFADAAELPEPTDAEVLEVCRALVSTGVLEEPACGWFCIAG